MSISSSMRRLLGVVLAVGLLVGVGWMYRIELLLAGVGILVNLSSSVDPNVPVSWSSGPDPAGRSREKRPPNIVLIVADDLGWNDITFAGGGVAGGTVPTPHIDSIAKEGVIFHNGYAGNATCAPARAALMSGRYSTRFGFEYTPAPSSIIPLVMWVDAAGQPRIAPTLPAEDDNTLSFEEMGMPPSEVTIAEVLRNAGYHTLHVGKWHLGRANGMAPHDQGFEESLMMESGLYLPEDDPGVVNAKLNFDQADRVIWRVMQHAVSFNGSRAFEPQGYLTDYLSDEAVKAIEANRERPFFLYLAHFAPHTPLQATLDDYEALSHIPLHRERIYAAMVRALDRGVGRVLDALRQQGLEENTLVIFTSDNGAPGSLGLPSVNSPYRGWKATFFEGGIHVPFFFKWPAQLPSGTAVHQPVHHFDVFATAASVAGAELPKDRLIDGIDLLPFAKGEADGTTHEALFWRSGASKTALVRGWKLNMSDPPGRRWVFDLRADPTERRNLAATRPDKVVELERAFLAHNSEQMNSRWPPTASFATPVDKDTSVPVELGDDWVYWSN
ncbi:MAG: sulfatase-like hydrolase/transferase [bacterium]|nr:sulfatase-like hydrolase/transferase [bacterium]